MSTTDLLATLAAARVYDLEQPRYAGAPTFPAHAPGVLLKLHRRHEPGLGESRTSASALLVMAEHSGTHIDALCHQAENLELHGGVRVNAQVQTPEGFTQLGIDTVPPLSPAACCSTARTPATRSAPRRSSAPPRGS